MNIRIVLAACALWGACIFSQAQAQAQAQEDSLADIKTLPMSNSPSSAYYQYKPLTFAQQQARFEAEQRAYRMEWNRWIGYSPLRPTTNASYMSGSYRQSYFSADRGVFINTGGRSWFW